MSEITLSATANGIFKSEDKSIVADTTFYSDCLILTTPKGKYFLQQDGQPTFPSYSAFFSGAVQVGGSIFEVQVEVLKRTAIMTW